MIYTIIDDTTRWVFAWSYKKDNKKTFDFLEKFLQKSPFSVQKIRTDQDKEFVANSIKDYYKEKGI